MQIATRRLLSALLLITTIGRLASAEHAIEISGAAAARANGAPLQRLCIDIDFDGPPMRPKLEASAMEEVTRIWVAYGVDVHKWNASDVRRESAIRLSVVFADHPDPRPANGVLGAIPFFGGVPEPEIVIYPNAIAALISTVSIEGHREREWPNALQDLILGRVLGRALAHEIGHFLLRSNYHSANGLMRAQHLTPDLIAADRRRFVLSDSEVTRLMSIASTNTQSTAPVF